MAYPNDSKSAGTYSRFISDVHTQRRFGSATAHPLLSTRGNDVESRPAQRYDTNDERSSLLLSHTDQEIGLEGLEKTSTGDVKGLVEVSDTLEITTSVGDVDLGVTNASPPSHTAFFDRLDGISSSDTGLQVQQASKDVCDLPPVAVNVGTSTGRVKVRYVGWEEPCRALSQNIHTSVGDVQVVGHLLCQGPYHLSTSLGGVNFAFPSTTPHDPTGLGSKWVMTVNKNDRVTSKSWWGEVMPWRAQRGGISSSSGWSGPRVVPKGEGDVCPHLDRGNNA